MSMVTRQIRCRKCGTKTAKTYPEGLSDAGVEMISLCRACLEREIREYEGRKREKNGKRC